MSAFSYLLSRQFKNYFLDLVRHPAKLIGTVLIILLIGLSMFLTFIKPVNSMSTHLRSIDEFKLISCGFFITLFYVCVYDSIDRGNGFFRLWDINLLFTAPISEKKVLLYGLIKQLGASLFVGVILLFQIPVLHRMYGISTGQCLFIFVQYLLFLAVLQVFCMLLYIYSNGKTNRKAWIKRLLVITVVVIVAIVLFKVKQGHLVESLKYINIGLTLFPFGGWSGGIVNSFLAGSMWSVVGYVAIYAISLGIMLPPIMKGSLEYYEDIISATEQREAFTKSLKTGKFVRDVATSQKTRKLRQVGLRKGKAASTLFYKHLLEGRRSNKMFINTGTILQCVAVIAISYFLKKFVHMSSKMMFITVIGFMLYVQLLLTRVERWSMELNCHYVYLLPASGFKKFIYSALEGCLRCLVENILIIGVLGLIAKVPIRFVIMGILLRVSFEGFLIAINLLSQRLLGTIANKGVFFVLYYFIAIIMQVPPILFGGYISIHEKFLTLGLSYLFQIILLCMIIWNILITFIISLLANEVFNTMELNE